MNDSFITADRTTHLKVVVIALAAAVIVAIIGINARLSDVGDLTASMNTNGQVVKAGRPAVYTASNNSTVR
jgi:Na+/citrate or Na+/malate symporter